MRRHRAVLCLLMAAVLLLLAGCADLTDLDRKAIVLGLGLDVGPAPGTVQVTLQYAIPGSTGGGGGGTPGGGGGPSGISIRNITVTATGADVTDALRRLRAETDRFVYFGNLVVIVLGRDLAARGVTAPLDYLLRDGSVMESTQVVVAQGSAVDLLASRSTVAGQGVALPLYYFLTNAERTAYPTAPNVLWRFFSLLDGTGRGTYAPLLAPSKQGLPFDNVGIALIRQGRTAAELTGYRAAVADWLLKSGGYPDAIVRLAGSPEPDALRLTRRRLSIRVLGPDAVSIRLGFRAVIQEAPGLLIDGRDIAALDHDASVQMRYQVRQVLNEMQAAGTDALGISDNVLARYPALASEAWPRLFSRLRIDLSVQVSLHEGGRKT